MDVKVFPLDDKDGFDGDLRSKAVQTLLTDAAMVLAQALGRDVKVTIVVRLPFTANGLVNVSEAGIVSNDDLEIVAAALLGKDDATKQSVPSEQIH